MHSRICCVTTFDITNTDRRNRPRAGDLTAARQRNQQRNWETINQIISLRCLPENIQRPRHDIERGSWSFCFDLPSLSAVSGHRPLSLLQEDCEGVPMILGLEEWSGHAPVLHSLGPDCNIWFSVEDDK